jgi:hypothetical protein
MIKKKPVNYLSNKELLAEIQNSKMSYCYALDNQYKQYDLIVESLDEITPQTIAEAKEVRAARLSTQQYDQKIDEWYELGAPRNSRPRQADFRVDPSDIQDQEIVIRVMTYEHIPESPGRKKNPKIISDHYSKLIFPPFKQYAYINGELTEVLRSHWEGGFDNGYFCQTQGKMTPKLARMMIKLVERYATRSNWRNYTYNSEMQGAALLQLSEVGLKFNEARSLNPFSYYTATITNSFTRVLNLEKRNHHIRDDLLQENGYLPSYSRQLDDAASQQQERLISEQQIDLDLKNAGYN